MIQTHSTLVAFTGSSMRPIFKPGDLLHVLPYEERQVRCGDVILFSCPSESCNVVHRVADIDARGIRTKGDNNAHVDPWIVSLQQVVGYVVHAQRGRRWRHISGGLLGRFVASFLHAAKYVSLTFSTALHPLCR
jgi:signal peptidase I